MGDEGRNALGLLRDVSFPDNALASAAELFPFCIGSTSWRD
jgi:hypothetical protein